MKPSEIKAQLEAAKQELAERLQEKMLLDLRVGQLSETINALTSLLAAKPVEPAELPGELFGDTGISAAIRLLLMRSETPLTPVQIKDGLTEHGFDLSDYANAMAVIHNTLKRLDRQGELLSLKDAGGNVYAYATRFQTPGIGAKRKRKSIGQLIGEG